VIGLATQAIQTEERTMALLLIATA
jgi:hypothetical protein